MSVRLLFLFPLLLSLTLTMSASGSSDDQPLASPDEASGPEQSPLLVRRSSRLASKGPSPNISEWPSERIITTLYSLNIQAPVGVTHNELFQFFLANVEDPNQLSSAPPHLGPRKQTSKRKNTCPNRTPPAKKRIAQKPSQSKEEDPVLSAL